jgi:hypothetical protein
MKDQGPELFSSSVIMKRPKTQGEEKGSPGLVFSGVLLRSGSWQKLS